MADDTLDAPTQTVTLTEQDRHNLVNLLHRAQAKTRDQARAVHNLRERVGVEGGSNNIRQFPDGMVSVEEPAKDPVDVELTDGEVSVVDHFLSTLEDQEQVPTSGPFIQLLDKVEPLIEETKSRSED